MGTDDLEAMLYFNGIDGSTGRYDLPPIEPQALSRLLLDQDPPPPDPALRERSKQDHSRPEELARLAREHTEKLEDLLAARSKQPPDAEQVATLQREVAALEQEQLRRQHWGTKEGVDECDLVQAGWGLVLPHSPQGQPMEAIVEALQPLLALRQAQTGPRFRIFQGPRSGYRTGESKSSFLLHNGASPSGPVDPERMPYYLLLIGNPEQIPFSFQYQLDVQYAVGRLWFPDVEGYAHYARNVVDAETDGIPRPRTLSLFGVRNPDDPATDRSARLLVEPLHAALATARPDWETSALVGEAATRDRLAERLGGVKTPALLFTASHGMAFPAQDPRQRLHQGALLCSDWPGPEDWTESIPERFYLAGDHLDSNADLAGMMLFCFACHGAGTPAHDEFAFRGRDRRPRQLAPEPFLASLPMALLGRPRGALAVVGHVDRAWECSFASGNRSNARNHITTFQSALERLLDEHPVGHALDYFNARYAELSTELSEELNDEFKHHDPYALTALWTANNDARSYVVLGDPAARLSFGGGALPPSKAGGTFELAASSGQAAPSDQVEVSSAEPVARPPELREDDWERTPVAVRRFIARLQEQLPREPEES